MHRGSRKDRGGGAVSAARRRTASPLSGSTDTSASSSRGDRQLATSAPSGGHMRVDSLKDFKERIDSTIQQLTGLVSLLSSRDAASAAAAADAIGGGGSSGGRRQQQPSNANNKSDVVSVRPGPPCCCRCHAGGLSQATSPLPLTSNASGAARRQARDFSAAISATAATPSRRRAAAAAAAVAVASGCVTEGDTPDASNAPAASSRRKAQPQQQPQPRTSISLAEPPSAQAAADSLIRFLWYDASRRRYAIREADLICAKSVKRLHLSVNYFRVAGEDLLLLEKDCSDDGLAFLDVDSVVAFEGLSVEKVLKLQKLGCQLRPEDLSREFAVEKGRSKYYVVPVEEVDGDWRLCEGAGSEKLDSLKRVLEQQELRRGAPGDRRSP